MKNLGDILYKSGLLEVEGSTDIVIRNIAFDSRKVGAGDLFVAVRGITTDGHLYIDQAVNKGARAIICEEMPAERPVDVVWVKVSNSSKALGVIASNYYDSPSGKVKVIGVTGTNGKTTISTLLHRLFSQAGHSSGLISTVINMIGDKAEETAFTTPDALEINRLLSEMAEKGCEYCFMEVSSHAVAQDRVEGIRFEGGVFSNISHDHLDYHKSFNEYLGAKKKFFDKLDSKAFALTNADDKNGFVVLQNTSARKYSYSLKALADFKGKVLENLISGLHMIIDSKDIWCKLVGEYNAYNLMAIYGTSVLLGLENEDVLRLISTLEPVEGRFDYFISDNKVMAVVDYAHTPDALDNVLIAISNMRTGMEKVITVIGCGGNRDASKRPVMASIAVKYSDKVILTSDNPRFENPDTIIEQMEGGLDPVAKKKAISITNRSQAIKTACSLAESGDVVLVAGKGHEKYQDVEGKKYPFDDKQILKEFLL